ncbi:MAG: acetate kinase, partial [Brevinema sp.]
MKILVLNAGSSSLKYQLLNTEDQHVIAKGVIEKIGLGTSLIGYSNEGFEKVSLETPLHDHEEALQVVFDSLIKGKEAVLSSIDEINAIGHRAVHGGETYNKTVLINEAVLEEMEKLCELAPLHNPANIMGIRACQKIAPNTPQVAIFDTAFHQTMEPVAYMYGIPYR